MWSLELGTNKCFVSIDVTFHEDTMPWKITIPLLPIVSQWQKTFEIELLSSPSDFASEPEAFEQMGIGESSESFEANLPTQASIESPNLEGDHLPSESTDTVQSLENYHLTKDRERRVIRPHSRSDHIVEKSLESKFV